MTSSADLNDPVPPDNNSPNESVKITKPGIAAFLRIWQILEIIGLLFSIPLSFGLGMLFTGDSDTLVKQVIHYVLPGIGIFVIVKIVVLVAFGKSKRWAVYFNFYQNILYFLLCLILIFASVYATFTLPDVSTSVFSALPLVLIAVLLFFLVYSYRKCLKHPYYQK